MAHWAVALGFFVAYLTEDVTVVHVWAGYAVGVLVLARVGWGFVGSRHARFSDFAADPVTATRYLWNLLRLRAKRYVGHSPAGGVMVITLLAFLAATVVTGLVRYAEKDGAGPLAPLHAQTSPMAVPGAVEEEGSQVERHDGESAFGEAHEVIANFTLGLILFHILGVLLARAFCSQTESSDVAQMRLEKPARAAEARSSECPLL